MRVKRYFLLMLIFLVLWGCYKSADFLPHGEDTGIDSVAPELDTAQDTHDLWPDVPSDFLPYEPYCGNGIVEGAEQCDDGNRLTGDGCESDCTFTCVADSDCFDSEICNGFEACDVGTHTCLPGRPWEDGFVCLDDPRSICIGGICFESSCGDDFIDTGAGEMCEPPGVGGCDVRCQLMCTSDADCPDDGNMCTGQEYCDTDIYLCERMNVPADGTVCQEDPRAVCVDQVCQASFCGDGFADTGAGEECDDENAVSGDGCEPDCTFTCVDDADCPPEEHCETSLHICLSWQNHFLDFDGSDDYVNLGNLNFISSGSSGEYTVEMWVRLERYVDTTYVYGDEQSANRGILFEINMSGYITTYYPHSRVASANIQIPLDTWTHVALVQDGSTVTSYVNGVFDATLLTSPDLHVETSDDTNLGRFPLGGRYFDGQLDEVRVWDYARTPDQLLAAKDTELTGSEPGLAAYYKMNEGSCAGDNAALTEIVDATGHGNDGMLHDFTKSGCSGNWVCGGATCGLPDNGIMPVE